MVKNSFSLFETILAITIIALLVSGFLKFTYPKTNDQKSLEAISNNFKQETFTLPHHTSYFTLFQDGAQLLQISGNKIIKSTYEDETFLFTRYEVAHSNAQIVESKVFE
ncbi:hypothetical protein [Candidatus Marinarcus aquaticus]|uniref:Uncharacterized protein n=1 Tax=Candidatus Marinarcus aquaticus TaxID=2044504 RepID=A0A4Q0XSR0_9BACT|nr:hypothetical protein [Candidatus Marinarcus aquaticus]RXJ60550.1 hypothetical protein CRV04_00605 [Candidatus Marinarcus aquaticus]